MIGNGEILNANCNTRRRGGRGGGSFRPHPQILFSPPIGPRLQILSAAAVRCSTRRKRVHITHVSSLQTSYTFLKFPRKLTTNTNRAACQATSDFSLTLPTSTTHPPFHLPPPPVPVTPTMAASLPPAVTAHLDALLHASMRPVSFRHLSHALDIPFRLAQSHLHAYAQANPSLPVHWAVSHRLSNGVVRLTLTATPDALPAVVSKSLWSLSPPDQPAPVVSTCLRDDVADGCALAAAPTHAANALRDGRFNAILSPTSVWTPAEEAAKPAQTRVAPKPHASSSLLAQVRKKVKAREAKQVTARNRSAPFKPAAEGGSLFARKRLGASAAERIRKDDEEKKRRKEKVPATKKARRIVDDDDDDDDDQSDAERERVAMKKEAAVIEAAEAEREEARRELEELTKGLHEEDDEKDDVEQDVSPAKDDLPESPQLKEVEENGKDGSASGGSPTKRKLSEAFGLPSRSGPRRIRREVEEMVEGDKGYLITRVVTKVFDEEDNELPDDTPVTEEPEKPQSSLNAALGKPLKPHNSQNSKTGKRKPGNKRKDGKRPSSKTRTSSTVKKTPKKKIKGNIMSYFGKKG